VKLSSSEKPKLNETHGQLLQRIGEAAAAIGTGAFHTSLLRILDCLIDADFKLVLRYSRHGKPVYLVNEGLPQSAVDLYLSGFYRFDPAQELWRKGSDIDVISFRDLAEGHQRSAEYFRVYAPRANIADDLGMFLPGLGGAAVAIFLERRRHRFSPHDVAQMRAVYPMFCELYRAHLNCFFESIAGQAPGSSSDSEIGRAFLVLDADARRICANTGWDEAECRYGEQLTAALWRLKSRGDEMVTIGDGLVLHREKLDSKFALAPGGYLHVLEHDARMLSSMDFEEVIAGFLNGVVTPREREIVRLMLLGYSMNDIADVLGVTRGTVKNHRQRLYDKLGISFERQIFAMFLNYLGNQTPVLAVVE
jgi:DNA-binding CsgD family transcriptional regulator